MNPHVAMDEESTGSLNERFVRHSTEARLAQGAKQRYHMTVARGLYKILTARALAGDDEVVIGAPHFITLSDEQWQKECAHAY